LIGYETRALAREDFNNDAVDAGDVGAGHQVTALFEIVPAGGHGRVDPLRYEAANDQQPADGSYELGYLKLRWKEPGASESTLVEQVVPNASAPAAEDQRFVAAIAGAAEIMRGSSFVTGWSLQDAQLLAQEGRGADPDGLRAQAISLMRYADSLQ